MFDALSGRIHYVPEWGWLEYQDGRWVKVPRELAIRLIDKAISRLNAGLPGVEPEEAEHYTRCATAMLKDTAATRKATLEILATRVTLHADDFAGDEMLFNFMDGTLNLDTGELQPHNPADHLMQMIPVDYPADATCPRFLQFLREIFPGEGSAQMIDYLQRVIGYSLTGRVSERAFFVWFGEGRNGKTTLAEVWQRMLGDYADSTPMSTFMSQRSSSIPNDLARLTGKRFVVASESKESAEMDVARVKQLTGGDTVTARFLNHEWFTYKPQFKCVLLTNHFPRIEDTSAIWDRLQVVEFKTRFSEDEEDRELPRKLAEEMPGILAWAVQGAAEWKRIGLSPPPEVRDAMQRHRHDSNPMWEFFDVAFDRSEPNARLSATEALQCYTSWKKFKGGLMFSPSTAQEFGREMKRIGHESKKNGKGYMEYRGLTIRYCPDGFLPWDSCLQCAWDRAEDELLNLTDWVRSHGEVFVEPEESLFRRIELACQLHPELSADLTALSEAVGRTPMDVAAACQAMAAMGRYFAKPQPADSNVVPITQTPGTIRDMMARASRA